MPDWGMPGRRDSYRIAAVDPFSLVERGDIDAVMSECSVTYGYYTDNLEQATITVTDESWQALGQGSLFRIYHTVELPDGTSETEILGTFFADTAEKQTDVAIPLRRCTCYSTMWRLSQDALAADFVAKKSTSCRDGIKKLITAEGAQVVCDAAVSNSARTHTQDARFAAGSNRLDAANTYAGWCGWQVGVDDYGRQTLSKYLPPRQRQVSHSFTDGEDCTYLPAIKETFTGDVCNRVVALWSRQKDAGDGYGTSARAVADLPDSSPYSYAACGRRMTHVLKVTEPKSAADLLAIAQDYLAEHDAAIRYIEIEHVGIPHLRAGDVVTYTNAKAGEMGLVCEVTQMDITPGPLMLTKSKLKVIL